MCVCEREREKWCLITLSLLKSPFHGNSRQVSSKWKLVNNFNIKMFNIVEVIARDLRIRVVKLFMLFLTVMRPLYKTLLELTKN